ncbi:MAG: BMFP domain-containing protein YqiC [Chitinophagales bacterium]|jgi:BMFP domain-containing protein YqiC
MQSQRDNEELIDLSRSFEKSDINQIMNDIPNVAADIINRIMLTAKAAVPESLSNDVKENVKAAIQDVISDLDVVTREELDTQKAVLEKTRAKVDQMELVIAVLEKKLDL